MNRKEAFRGGIIRVAKAMVLKMLFKKLLRTVGLYRSQFISMIIMIALGVGVFVGFNMEWMTIDKNTSSFFEETNEP